MLKRNKIKIKLNGKLISVDKGINLDILIKKIYTLILIHIVFNSYDYAYKHTCA